MPDRQDDRSGPHPAVRCFKNPQERASTDGTVPVVIGFRVGTRFLGRAIHRPCEDPELCPLRRRQPLDVQERTRIGIWIRQSIARCGAHGIALFVEDLGRARTEDEALVSSFIRSAAMELGIPLVEIMRAELVSRLRLPLAADAAIHQHLADRFRPLLARAHPWAMHHLRGARTEIARYWKMPAVALGAALVAADFFGGPSPSLSA